MSGWITWAASAVAFLAIGVFFFRRGSRIVFRLYMAACAALLVANIFGIGALLGDGLDLAPRFLLLALLPAAVVLAVWAAERDRKAVMGRHGEREAAITAALLYGAGSGGHGGDAGGGGAEM